MLKIQTWIWAKIRKLKTGFKPLWRGIYAKSYVTLLLFVQTHPILIISILAESAIKKID